MFEMKTQNEATFAVTEGVLPVITISGETLPEVWEKAVEAVWEHGAEIITQYDKPGDPPSKDATALLTIQDPLAEPRIHRAFPGGIDNLEVYRQEVVDGIHDHWIDRKGESERWRYGYHERLFAYTAFVDGSEDGHLNLKCAQYDENGNRTDKDGFIEDIDYAHYCTESCSHITIDQMQYIINTLVETPHSRRAQAVLWQPWFDTGLYDCPCLRSLWFRIFDNQLVMNIHMRSNDLFKATFMNLWSYIDIQRLVAEKISERLGKTIKQGPVNHFVDSLHIYGSYNKEVEAFLNTLKTRTFDQRTWTMEYLEPMFEEAKEKIKKSIEEEKRTGRKGL